MSWFYRRERRQRESAGRLENERRGEGNRDTGKLRLELPCGVIVLAGLAAGSHWHRASKAAAHRRLRQFGLERSRGTIVYVHNCAAGLGCHGLWRFPIRRELTPAPESAASAPRPARGLLPDDIACIVSAGHENVRWRCQ